MSKSKRKKSYSAFKLWSIILLIISLMGILGTWGIFPGKQLFAFLTMIFGRGITLVSLGLSLILGLFLLIYSETLLTDKSIPTSSSEVPKKSGKAKAASVNFDQPLEAEFKQGQAGDVSGIFLPAGKLVPLKGFNEYFSSPELVEMKDVDNNVTEDMKEIGENFSSYFAMGDTEPPKVQSKIGMLNGLSNYFEAVDYEEKQRRLSAVQESPSSEKKLDSIKTGENKTCEKPSPTSIFKSEKDQKEFLALFKDAPSLKNDQVTDIINTNNSVNLTESREEDEPETAEKFIFSPSGLSRISRGTISHEAKTLNKLTLELETENEPQSESSDYAALSVKPAIKYEDHWQLPDYDLLDLLPERTDIQNTETPKQLEKVLLDFGVKAKVIRVTIGPVITRYELAPAPGVKISKIVNLADDIALGLAARDVRIEAPIPGKAAIGIEVPNKHPRPVPFREVLATESFRQYPSKLKVALGKDIANQTVIADLITMPHLLVAGATGSGKSVCITTIINSILYNATPDEVKFLLVDPKMVELNQYNGIPHLLAPVVIDPKKAASALKWIVKEMETRYELFAAAGVRDIERYNKLKAGDSTSKAPALSLIVVIIDELADLMVAAAGDVEEAIGRLAQMARAAGIHLVIATQRPSVDVITGVIKANIPSRISFAVSSQIDSRTILDTNGAEKLLGRGDMLYSPLGLNKPLRVQGCLVTDDEVQRIIMHWKRQGKPEYLDPASFNEISLKTEEGSGSSDDDLFIKAGQLFIKTGMASVSFLQRKLKLGYTRAARLMDMLEEQGVVGGYEGSKPRRVLLTLEEFNERFG